MKPVPATVGDCVAWTRPAPIPALVAAALLALALTACGRNDRIPPPPPLPPTIDDARTGSAGPAEPEPVDADLLAAPDSAFVAVEPTEVGVAALPDIREAISPLLAPEGQDADSGQNGALQLTIAENGDSAVVDIVRKDLPDDAVAAGQVRIEFHRQPEGWFPTNAYRRNMCRRGAYAMQWTTQPCP